MSLNKKNKQKKQEKTKIYHWFDESHPDPLMLDVGSVKANCHFDFIKHVESVFFHFEGRTLGRKKKKTGLTTEHSYRIKQYLM